MPEFAQAFSRSRKLPGHFWTLGDKAALPAGTRREETLDLVGCDSPLPAELMRDKLTCGDPASHRLLAYSKIRGYFLDRQKPRWRPWTASVDCSLISPPVLLVAPTPPDAGTATSAIASRAACRASKRARATSPARASTVTLLLRACLDTSGRPPTANYDLCRSVCRVLGGQGAHESSDKTGDIS